MGTLWFGGKIRTLISAQDIAEAVYVKDGIIQKVGSYKQLCAMFKDSISKEINLKGATMFPGFVDSHLHMIGHGEKLLKLDVSEVSSIEELKKILLNKLSTLGKWDWLLAEGFNENLFPNQKIPDRSVLDDISTEHPMMITRVCRHAIVTNSLGLQLAGINSETFDPPGGLIERDTYGVPTGYMHDQAQELVKQVIPDEDSFYIKKALTVSLADLFRHGYTGAHTEDLNYYGNPEDTLQTFFQVIDGVKKKFRANLLIHHEVAPMILMKKRDDHNPFIEMGSIKIFADGALGGRTALLSEPYSDDTSTRGVAIHTPDNLAVIVKNARELHMPVAIHTIGDLALEYAILAIEKYPVPDGKRDRLIHLQVTRKELLERLQKLPVALDIQPRFVASDFPWVQERLGEKRLGYSFAWRTFLDHGLICAGGSDAPIEPVDPLYNIHAAVTRRKSHDKHDGYGANQKLTLYEALKLITLGSAQAICKEKEYGLISEGYKADFTILSDDLFTMQPDEWLHVKVEKTVVDNSIMYERKS